MRQGVRERREAAGSAGRFERPYDDTPEGYKLFWQQSWFAFDDNSGYEYAFRTAGHGGRGGASTHAWHSDGASGGHGGAGGGRRGDAYGDAQGAQTVDRESRHHLQTLELTEVPRTAAALKAAYLCAAKKHHPDACGPGSRGNDGRRFHAVQSAYAHLKGSLVLL